VNAVSPPYRLGILSVVPSPYQRDLFSTLAARPEIEIDVFYQSAESVDNPWPETTLAPYEHLLPGWRMSYGKKRAYANWDLPDFHRFDLTIINTSYVSTAAQWLMRTQLRDQNWVFWGERMRTQPSWWRRLGQRTLSAPLQRANAIVGIGSLAVNSYRHAFPDQQLYNIPYFCDLSPFVEERRPAQSDGPVTILFCGQMIKRKGVDLLLRAVDRLVKGGEDVRLRLVGREAALPEMLSKARSETRARVDVLGFRPPEELPALFGDSDVFVLPSRHDGWGVVVNQALGAGLPIICSEAVGAAHDLVEPGRNGDRVAAGTVEPLYDSLRRVVANDTLRNKWAEAARTMAAKWTLDEGADRWIRAVQKEMSRSSEADKMGVTDVEPS
jgi:glycosyltransferase involved in cell wall biosynthesis